MKHLSRLLSLLILVSAGVFFTNCGGGGGEEPDPEQEQLDKLVGTWTVTDAELNDADKAEFVGAQLTITSNKLFNFSNDAQIEGSPWPPSENWEFGADVTQNINRLDPDGNVPLIYSVSGNSLTIKIPNYTGDAYTIGKVKSVEGTWDFTFTK